MIFNQWFYFILLFTSLLVFFAAPKKYRNLVLFLSGILFYFYFAKYFLILILFETIFIYLLLAKKTRPGVLLVLITCVVFLGYFKYRSFFFNTLNDIFSLVNVGFRLPIGELAIPLAISFFSFEFIHLILDVKRKKIKTISFWHVAAFIFFFPTLVAGPIKRFNQFNPQIETAKFVPLNFFVGFIRIILGFFKKLVLADTFAVIGGDIFTKLTTVQNTTIVGLWIALISYSFRIYFDFSGYSDIAIGSARLFDIRIPENFLWPYLRPTIADFWKNWHRSLYSWILDYIYIPLGGGRKGLLVASRNTMIAFAISGLWHGAAWHFTIWGLYHGSLLVIYRIYKRVIPGYPRVKYIQTLVTLFSITFTFILVSIGWLFFITRLDVALYALSRMLMIKP